MKFPIHLMDQQLIFHLFSTAYPQSCILQTSGLVLSVFSPATGAQETLINQSEEEVNFLIIILFEFDFQLGR